MVISGIKERIDHAERVIITCHVSPDGDALGSALALYGLLKKIREEVFVVTKEEPSKELSFLPYFNEIVVDEKYEVQDEDLLIVLDCGNVERININYDVLSNIEKVINIDHHKSNEEYGIINWVDSRCAAVGEMIFKFAKDSGLEIGKEEAECLYTSLVTDTGAFKYGSTSAQTHNIAGELISKGIDFTTIHERVFERRTHKQMMMQAVALNSMEMYYDGKLCIMEVTSEDIERVDAANEELGDLVNLGMMIDTVEVTLLMKVKGDIVKGSLRSRKHVDVCEVAGLFGGGGHVRASGFSTKLTNIDIKEKILDYLKGNI